MKCLKCQSDNREGVKFCEECGAKLELECPGCGAKIPLGRKFCGECGHDLKRLTEAPQVDYDQPQSYTPKFLADKILTTRTSIEGERKLVTVLFADVANYTSISEKLDLEEVHEIMDGCFKILMEEIHRYEGTINQFTGDGVMAIFGAPVAHEDHSQRACHAALSIQSLMEAYADKIKKAYGADFKMRIGLNSGPVMVGSIGDDLRMDYTAVGDTTNLAARMESMADPGTVLATQNTHRLTRDFFEFNPLGKVQVKGKESMVEAYELIRTSAIETRIEAAAAKGLSQFVGRMREMETLKEALDKVRSGSGQVVGIIGEAGVGKSRLVFELRSILPEGQYTYLEGRCLHFGGSMAYLPILDLLRSYFGITEGEPEHVIKKKIEDKIIQLDENLLGSLYPFYELLSLPVEDEEYLRLESQQRREKTFEALRDLLIRESQRRPLVLVVEDLHWIDRTSEELLSYLIEWLATAHILLIILYRPEFTHQWGSKSYYTKIGVDQLSNEISTELVQYILKGADILPEINEFILPRAGGNPLFVEELTHSLLENGSIQREKDQYLLAKKAEKIQVPDTIQGIIAARIDRLEENLKRVLQVASVIGKDFAFRILQIITGMRQELKSHLLNLQGLEFIYEKSLFPELEYIFKHALTQEVAYNSLLVKRRKEIHDNIGKAIESLYPDRLEEFYEFLAYHYSLGDNKEKAVTYLDLANQKSARVHAMEEAKSYFDQAMKILDALPQDRKNRERRISLLINNSIVHQLLFRIPEYHDLLRHYESLAMELDNPEMLGPFYARLGHCEWSICAFDQSIQTLRKAAQLSETSGRHEDAGYAYQMLQWSHFYKGDYDQVLKLKQDVHRSMEQRFNLRWYVLSFATGSMTYAQLGRWDEAVEEGKRGVGAAEEYSDNSLISLAGWSLSQAYGFKGDTDRALEYAELALQKSPTPADRVWSQGSLAWAWCRAGEPQKAIEVISPLLEIQRAGRFRVGELHFASMLSEAYWMAGNYEKAEQTIHEILENFEPCGARFYMGFSYRLLGEIAIEKSLDVGGTHFEKSIALLKEIKAENELALAYAGYGRLLKKQGKIPEARDYLSSALEILDRLGTLIEPDKVREELSRLENSTSDS